MKKYVVIIATVVLLLLVFAPATYAAPPAWGGWNNCQGTCYVVKYGDTLFSIGRRFGVNPWQIAHVNRLHNPHRIYAGQVLYIPPSRCCWERPVRIQPWPQQNHWPPRHTPYDGGYGYGYGYGEDAQYGYGYSEDAQYWDDGQYGYSGDYVSYDYGTGMEPQYIESGQLTYGDYPGYDYSSGN